MTPRKDEDILKMVWRERRETHMEFAIRKANSSIEAVRVKLGRLITKPVEISKPVSQSKPFSKYAPYTNTDLLNRYVKSWKDVRGSIPLRGASLHMLGVSYERAARLPTLLG